MSITFIKGNLFNSSCQTLVNTVNCVGVMGKGIALVYRLRYPQLYTEYQQKCLNGQIEVGKLWLYSGTASSPNVLNFPTKTHWRLPSRVDYLERGLRFFKDNYNALGITSVAFPLLGAHNGGLERDLVVDIMSRHLSGCDIPIEIYQHDPTASDNLFEAFRHRWLAIPPQSLAQATTIKQKTTLNLISEILSSPKACSLTDLLEHEGIGLKTLSKCYSLVMAPQLGVQTTLF